MGVHYTPTASANESTCGAQQYRYERNTLAWAQQQLFLLNKTPFSSSCLLLPLVSSLTGPSLSRSFALSIKRLSCAAEAASLFRSFYHARRKPHHSFSNTQKSIQKSYAPSSNLVHLSASLCPHTETMTAPCTSHCSHSLTLQSLALNSHGGPSRESAPLKHKTYQ